MRFPRLPYAAIGNYLVRFVGVGWVYVLTPTSAISVKPVAKVGLKTDTHHERISDIAASVDRVTGKKNKIKAVWFVPSSAPREVERIVHYIYRPLRSDRFKGSSGQNEWFFSHNIIAALIILGIGLLNGGFSPYELAITGIGTLAALIFPLPLDLIFIVTLVALLQNGITRLFYAGLSVAFYFFINHIF